MIPNPAASRKQLEASDPSATVWVNANAGSGKTHVLVDRVVRLMLDGTEPSRIMCLTFTKAAAAEMANRLFDRLSKWIALDDDVLRAELTKLDIHKADTRQLERARQLFTRALETPGGLKIQTIHAFAERVLQLFPVEAGVVPHFSMLDDRESLNLLEEARNDILIAAKADESSALGAALLDVANRVSADGFDSLLSQLLAKRSNLRALFVEGSGLERAESLLRIHMSIEHGVTRETLLADLACNVKRYRELADALDGGTAAERKRGAEIRSLCIGDDVRLTELRNILLTGTGEPRQTIANQATLGRYPWIEDLVKADQARLVDALGRMGDLECLSATLSLLRLGGAIVERFEQVKRSRGAYDFDDLIIKTGELLSQRPDAAWVLYKLDGGIEHLLVDEAQDTSPMQWQIIRSLTEEFFAGEGRHGSKSRTLFVVGDRKQSIYSFQGADPGVFESVLEDVRTHVEAADQEFRDVDFSVSFRSTPEVLDAVDRVFAPNSVARSGLDGDAHRDWHHESNRRNAKGVVEIWPLTIPQEKEERDPWQVPVDREPAHSPGRRLAKKLAQTIKGWISQRMLPAHNRAVEAGDILILVRRRNNFFDAMIRALWNENIPVAGADRLKLGENIAVLDLVALAQFTTLPEDDHALACILKSPILAQPLLEEDLMALAARRGPASLWQALQQRDGEPYRSAAALLQPLIAAAPSARPFEFLSGVLASARLRFVSRLGSEANDAIDALLDRALDYEEANGTSLAGFVNWFQAAEIEIKRNMEQGTDEVRVMTVHGAKGLEAPIVILPDTVAGFDSKRGTPLLMLDGGGDGHAKVPLWPVPRLAAAKAVSQLKAAQKDVEIAEYRRLLYVAMTRAGDELYICGYRGKQEPAADCWYETIGAALKPVMEKLPGEAGWRLGAAPVSVAGVQAGKVEQAIAWPGWIGRASAASGEKSTGQPPPRRRASAGVERGILIHRILQNLPDLPESGRTAYIEATLKRAGAEASLVTELIDLVAHPVLADILSADGHSEAALITCSPDGQAERRRIDRLVETADGILVADYKTDRVVPNTVEDCNPDYLMQLAIYRDALKLAKPGKPMRFCLVWTEGPSLMPIPEAVLERMAALRQPQP